MSGHDEALVEKVCRVLELDAGDPILPGDLDGLARAVLDAVADDLRADAWIEGYLKALDDARVGEITTNPYRDTGGDQ